MSQARAARNNGRPEPIVILVGDSQRVRALGLQPDRLPKQEYVIRCTREAMVLAGRDKDDRGAVQYDQTPNQQAFDSWPGIWDEQGTMYAVYDFLERHCNVRWFTPTEFGTDCPRQATLTVTGTVTGADGQRSPFMKYRYAAYPASEAYNQYTGLWPAGSDGQKKWEAAAYPDLHRRFDGGGYTLAKRGWNQLFRLRHREGGEQWQVLFANQPGGPVHDLRVNGLNVWRLDGQPFTSVLSLAQPPNVLISLPFKELDVLPGGSGWVSRRATREPHDDEILSSGNDPSCPDCRGTGVRVHRPTRMTEASITPVCKQFASGVESAGGRDTNERIVSWPQAAGRSGTALEWRTVSAPQNHLRLPISAGRQGSWVTWRPVWATLLLRLTIHSTPRRRFLRRQPHGPTSGIACCGRTPVAA